MKYFDYQAGDAAKWTRIPFEFQVSIRTFLQDAALEIEKDTQTEGKERANLVMANNFLQFFRKQKEDFEAFGQFVADYSGNFQYECKHLDALTHCVMMFKCPMPNKIRLLELTNHLDWLCYVLEDPDICRFVVDNFSVYAKMTEKYTDKDGTQKSFLEIIYSELQEMDKKKSFDLTSSQSTLLNMLYHFLQPYGVGV